MSCFFCVHGIPVNADEYEIIGVFTNSEDADSFSSESKRSGRFLTVGDTECLEMPLILDLLVRDRLKELAAPIIKLAATKSTFDGGKIEIKGTADLASQRTAYLLDRIAELEKEISEKDKAFDAIQMPEMRRREMKDYPENLKPEHDRRSASHDNDLHPEVCAAYKYVNSVINTTDFIKPIAWHGWALREAFLAGITYKNNNQEK